jgi:wyosine [tRNA(Phe)-imidazoG37] synthetase (radical SAM superfamily)
MPLLPVLDEVVYGPVRSRRLGASLGVNVFPAGRKVCNFNCAYCQYGWTREREAAVAADAWPAPEAIADAVRRALRTGEGASRALDRITLAGNGEPTLHPRFGEIVDRLRTVRDEECADVRLAVLSNAGTLERPVVVDALRRTDEAYLKLDTADSEIFKRLNGAASGLPRLLETLRALSHVTHVVIQSLFTRDAGRRIDNTTPDAVERWIGALTVIAPEGVHVYTIDREPAWAALEKIPYEELNAIAARARAAGLNVNVF